jgi:hypothetical protein
MRWIALAIFIFFYNASAHAASKADPDCASGSSKLLKCQLKGFTCTPMIDGDMCVVNSVRVSGFNYTQPVAVLIPPGVTTPQNILLHLHGFKGVCEDASAPPLAMEKEFGFLTQMRQAGATDSVMVFPMSRGQCTDYNNQLVGQFAGFTKWASGLLKPATDEWVISGHSGAGMVISAMLSANPKFVRQVSTIMLLDATYGISSRLGQWDRIVAANPGILIAADYTTRAGTSTGFSQLRSHLAAKRIALDFKFAWYDSHCVVPKPSSGTTPSDYVRFLKKGLARTTIGDGSSF